MKVLLKPQVAHVNSKHEIDDKKSTRIF